MLLLQAEYDLITFEPVAYNMKVRTIGLPVVLSWCLLQIIEY